MNSLKLCPIFPKLMPLPVVQLLRANHQLPWGDATRPVILRRGKDKVCEVRAYNDYRPRVGVISLSS